MSQDNAFRCYVYRDQDGQYVARCLDLLLVDVRDTMDKAIAALDENILGYLEAMGEMSTASTLIPRPYPPRQWLHFYALLILNTVKTLLGRKPSFLYFVKRVEGDQLVYA